MIKQKQALIIFCLACIILPSCFSKQKHGVYSAEMNVIKAAHDGLEHYLSFIPHGHEELFGFENRDDFSSAGTGRAYQLLALTPEFYETGQLDHGNYIMPQDKWFVSVETHAEANALLRVAMKDGAWQTVGIGASNLAKELALFDKNHVQEEDFAKVLRVPQLTCDLLIVLNPERADNERVYLLESARIALNAQIEPEQYYSLNEALLMIKQKL